MIKDMVKPKSCYAVIDGKTKYCPFVNTDADDDCILLLEKGIWALTWEEQYADCPLVELPEKHGRLVDVDELSKAMYHDAFESDTDLQKWDSGCWIRYKMFENNRDNAPTVIESEG